MKNRVGKLNKKITMIGGWVELYLKIGCVLEGGVNERKNVCFRGNPKLEFKIASQKGSKMAHTDLALLAKCGVAIIASD